MIILSVLLLIIVTLILIISRYQKNKRKYFKYISGPKPIFPFGNTLDLVAGTKVYLKVLKRYLDSYGETVIIHDGPFSQLILTTDYEFCQHIYNSTVEINKADHYHYLDAWLGEGLLTSKGYKWRTHRKAITPAFHFSILQNFVQVFEQVGTKLVDKLSKKEGEECIDISKIISLYTLDVICEAAMGVKINALEVETSDYIKSVKELCLLLSDKLFLPINNILYPLTYLYYREKNYLKTIHGYVEMVIRQRRKEHEEKPQIEDEDLDTLGQKRRLAFLDLLLETNIDNEPLSLSDLKDEVNTFMFEGHDTTAAAISFCLYLVARNPSIQQKIIEEQHALFGNDLKDARVSYANLNEMKYLEMVIKETLRYYPPIPFVGRQLTKDLEFKGTLYPKNTNIVLGTYFIHRSDKYFKDPERFLPERFADSAKKTPYAYAPFSAGSRNCIGQKFAMLEMLSAISKVVRHFHLIPVEHELQISAEIVLLSKTGMKIAIKERVY
ncbi:cytochrome P450 4d2-like [Rhynchophorus ferrugineus]|uniref:cytochrome P450 4d2-like n=1 Tax=Rhynchophorus ferrugineus TaxID=354439 RepID=UPI003FCCB75E